MVEYHQPPEHAALKRLRRTVHPVILELSRANKSREILVLRARAPKRGHSRPTSTKGSRKLIFMIQDSHVCSHSCLELWM
ncbi:uncharacterized protein YALI1_E17889g [Yarrowia lipolytica]|uniref:Uncharacterized protein n=1 Tax=Yarrowia lipolytica TaxID=4952 RepID=A0A1D8NIH5_YARLL|nr:hypothetical protein YALI1_E17889g [Yarrowia lipolytica]